MYEHLRVIEGRLYRRSTPRCEWSPVADFLGAAAVLVALLNGEDRLRLFSCFCGGCGCVQGERRCQCRNDE